MIRMLAIALLALASCSKPAAAPKVAPPPPAEAAFTAALDAYLTSQLPAAEPGGAVLVAKQGRTVFARGYGLADLKTRQPVTTATLFNLGSISKTFVANAILILHEQGKLSLDDNLLKHFPGFKDKALAAQVTIAHLLTHTSGLPDNRKVRDNRTFFLTAKDAENWYPVTQADALEFTPGSQFAYSNPAYNGLALIVEQVSGTKWQTFIRDRIFLPAGMTTSTITDGPHPETGVAHGYALEDGTWLEADYGEVPTFAASGNGGVWSSVDELARYERALERGVFLTPATIAASRTPRAFPSWTAPEPPFVGWSWFVGTTDTTPALPKVGHTGSQGGFTANYFTIPSKGLLVVILTASPRDLKAITNQITQLLAGAAWLD